MMVDFGEVEVLVGQMAQARERLVDVEATGGDCLQQMSQLVVNGGNPLI
jgi:hypothetical protein